MIGWYYHAFALLLLMPLYRPLGFRWYRGKLEIRVKWAIGHPGGQTFGQITFYTIEPWDALREHEDTHTFQYQVLGPLMAPLYGVGCIIGLIAGHYHDRNPLELWAKEVSGVI